MTGWDEGRRRTGRPVPGLPLLGAAMIGAVTILSGPPPARADDKPAAKADPLVSLNKVFRQVYARERTALIARTGPVIVVAFDSLVRLRDGKVDKADFTPPIYHEAKAIAHIPLALYVWLQARTGMPLDDSFLSTLAQYRSKMVAGADSLAGRPGWTPEILETHRRIVAASQALIDEATTQKRISADRLARFTREMRPLVLVSADVAAGAQLDGLHALVGKWRAEMGDDWGRTRFVVLTSRQARKDNLQFTYFLRLLGPEAVGTRLISTENVWNALGGRNQLGTVLLDRSASVAFFGDPGRLERDLLGEAARRHVARLFTDE